MGAASVTNLNSGRVLTRKWLHDSTYIGRDDVNFLAPTSQIVHVDLWHDGTLWAPGSGVMWW